MLTDTRITKAKPKGAPYRLPDGGALFLDVKTSGVKSWLYRYRLNGKQGIFTIGRYYDGKQKPSDHVSLDEARCKRDGARASVRQGLNPALERRKDELQRLTEGENTLQFIAPMWVDENKEHWSLFHFKKVDRNLTNDVFPVIGDMACPIFWCKLIDRLLDKIGRLKAHGIGW